MKKAISVLLSVMLLLGVVTAAPLSTDAAETDESSVGAAVESEASSTDEPTFTQEYFPQYASDLKWMLESNGNYKIKLTKDLSYRIGKQGDVNSPIVDYWCTLGTGVKVLDLNGHRFDLYNDHQWTSDLGTSDMTIFRVPSGAELVVNDTTGEDTGEIHYDGSLGQIGRSHSGDPEGNYTERRHLIAVTGGKLTFNGGKLIAGRSKKVYDSGYAKYLYRQINGNAVVLKSGEAVLQGGEIQGRGFTSSMFSNPPGRAAAVKATGGTLKIYDGAFWGMGCADTLQIADEVDIQIYGGAFDVHKQDFGILDEDSTSIALFEDSSYGTVGIPQRESARDCASIYYYLNNKLMSTTDRANGGADQVSKRVYVCPRDNLGATVKYSTADMPSTDPAVTVSGSTTLTLEWDKRSKLAFGIADSPYFPLTRSFDYVYSHTFPQNTVTFSTSPDGKGVSDMLTDLCLGSNNGLDENGVFDDAGMINLANIPAVELDALEVGNTYYLQLSGHESWVNHYIFDRLMKPSVTIKITIVPFNDAISDFDVGFEWSNHYDKTNLVSDLKLTPDIDPLTMIYNKGLIDEFRARFVYKDSQGNDKTYEYPVNTLGDYYTGGDTLNGANDVRFYVRIFRHGKFYAEKSASATAVCFPYITTSVQPDESGNILIDASSGISNVTFYTPANNLSGLRWTRDGATIRNSNTANYTANLYIASNSGVYTVAYYVNGKTYLSDQRFYLGVKDGERSISISTSQTSCYILGDYSSTPTLTATTTGDWGDIRVYYWTPVVVPYNAPFLFNKDIYTPTTTLAEALGVKDHETWIVPGTYRLSCTAYDVFSRSATSNIITIVVKRPATGLEIHTNEFSVGEYSSPDLDVTNQYVVVGNESSSKTVYLDQVMTPENSTGSFSGFSSSKPAVASITNKGRLTTGKAGTAVISGTVTSDYGTFSAQTTVLVSKNKYNVYIPDSWLEVEAGGTVHRGALNVASTEDYTAELAWMVMCNSNYWNPTEYTGNTFDGNCIYQPVLKIYPKEGVCYPVKTEVWNGRLDYTVKKSDFEITVNGTTYYGADECGREEIFFGTMPVSSAESSDYIRLDMDPTELIVDERDDYIDTVVFSLIEPGAGDPKKISENMLRSLDYISETDAANCVTDTLKHVTDPSTIRDDDFSNDAVEDFTTYEAGETYRSMIWITIPYKYTNSEGGTAYFTDDVVAVDPEHRTLTDNSSAPDGILKVYCYFTIGEPEYILGDANNDGKINIRDVSAIQRDVAEYCPLFYWKAGDVDLDGAVTINDATYLQEYLAEFIDEL